MSLYDFSAPGATPLSHSLVPWWQIAKLNQRIADLEKENAELKASREGAAPEAGSPSSSLPATGAAVSPTEARDYWSEALC